MFGREKKGRVTLTVLHDAENGWGLRVGALTQDGGFRSPLLRSHTQEGAVTVARTIGKAIEYVGGNAELIVHGEDGTIHAKDSYGADPRRIKG